MDDSSIPPAVERSQIVLDSVPAFVSVHTADESNTCTDAYYGDDPPVDIANTDLIGTSLSAVWGADAAEQISRSIEQTVDTDSVQYAEFQAQLTDKPTWYGAYLAPIDDDSQADTDEVVLAAFDITRLKEEVSMFMDAIDAIVRQSPQYDLDRAFCGRLVDQWPYEMAWIGELDQDGVVSLRGEENATEYISDLNRAWQDLQSTPDPGVRALKNGEIIHADATDENSGEWATIARQYGIEAAVALPLSHAGTDHGVLTVYTADASSIVSWRRRLLKQYAAVMSYVFTAETWKRALTTDATAQIDFEIRDGSPLMTLCADAGADSLSIDGVFPRDTETVYRFKAVNCDQRALRAAVIDHPSMQPHTGGSAEIEGLVLSEPVPENDLARRGLRFSEYHVLSDGMQISTVVPTADLVGYANQQMKEGYSGVSASIRWDVGPSSPAASSSSLAGILTSKQHEALETAYQLGYFKRDPDVNLTDIADALDKSRWTVSEHLRLAHKAIIEHHQ